MMQDNIIEKIKKLFAMAQRHVNNDGSSNEAEASAAMARAQELLAKYNLDLKAVEDAQVKDAQAVPGGPREKTQINRSAQYRWQQEFWSALAKANYCWHWVVTVQEEHYSSRTGRDYRNAKRHVILGSAANVAAVTVMGEYLTEVIERLLPYKANERLSRSALSWREGCAQRLIERIEEKLAQMKREGVRDAAGNVTCTALAVQDLHEKEYAANYDAQYGAGAYARMKKRDAEWTVQMEARRKEQEEERARQLAGETPEQRTKREKAEARAAAKQQARAARYWERQRHKARREAARRDIAAYARGAQTAESVNLDAQVKAGKDKERLG